MRGYPSFRYFALLALAFSVMLTGCEDRMALHPVSGSVKFEDGSIPQGEMATITFVPTNQMEGKGASGNIESDGTFQLWTLEPGDGGALAGDYRVTLSVTNGYPNLQHQVARQYTDLRDTPLTATVIAGEDNVFDFVVDKPGKKKKRR